jgi:MbtH protein
VSPEQDDRTYSVVVNHEEQYSIWLSGKELPPGWTETEKRGPRSECLAYIEEIWTDIRPLSLRRRLERDGAES